MRTLARYHAGHYAEVLTWHLRDALLAYEHALRERARVEYHHALLLWAIQSPYAKKGSKPPAKPRILQD